MMRHPAILATCPAIDPVDPAAAETRNVSPGFGLPTSRTPKYEVHPLGPMSPMCCRMSSISGSTTKTLDSAGFIIE